ncbi:hypothetical protein AMATHDRAFT_55784 [Amanita thiersii Skay4041]|uniref:NAD-dependent epimerase/dehydratase domain-containing protein n=1 Tax=Amanita thiersii Skay4041 TaxID=703135 RepID=A0A2A9NY87_9AGAR|nr:hypothetical protein AMATHDRAFT_55784 [Amanita thiersii Skay4041]
MKLAVTGSNGLIGKCVVTLALERGHQVVGIDWTPKPNIENDRYTFVQTDLHDYEAAKKSLEGCDGVIHLAAIVVGGYEANCHNSNVTMSWNVLRACSELRINRVAQASSVNVITLYFAAKRVFEYFPIDEEHPCRPDEPYGLSKLFCELQADSLVRRFPSMRIASLRPHWVVPNKEFALQRDELRSKDDLFAYVKQESIADAFLLAVTDESGRWSGHEAFIIAAPTSAVRKDSKELMETYWPGIRVKEGKNMSGNASFFDCSKAGKLLGWVHQD